MSYATRISDDMYSLESTQYVERFPKEFTGGKKIKKQDPEKKRSLESYEPSEALRQAVLRKKRDTTLKEIAEQYDVPFKVVAGIKAGRI